MVTRRNILLGAAGAAMQPQGASALLAGSSAAGTIAPAAIGAEALRDTVGLIMMAMYRHHAAENVTAAIVATFDRFKDEKKPPYSPEELEERLRKQLVRDIPQTIESVAAFRNHLKAHLQQLDPVILKEAQNALVDIQNKALLKAATEISDESKRVDTATVRPHIHPDEITKVRDRIDSTLKIMQKTPSSGQLQDNFPSLNSALVSIEMSAWDLGFGPEKTEAIIKAAQANIPKAAEAVEVRFGLAKGSLKPLMEAAKSPFFSDLANGGAKESNPTIPPLTELLNDDILFTRLARMFEVPASASQDAKETFTPVIREEYEKAFKAAFPEVPLKPEYLPSIQKLHVQEAQISGEAGTSTLKADSGLPSAPVSILARLLRKKEDRTLPTNKVDASAPVSGKSTQQPSTPSLPEPEAPIEIQGTFTGNVARERVATVPSSEQKK